MSREGSKCHGVGRRGRKTKSTELVPFCHGDHTRTTLKNTPQHKPKNQLGDDVGRDLCENYYVNSTTPLEQYCNARSWLVDSTHHASCEFFLFRFYDRVRPVGT